MAKSVYENNSGLNLRKELGLHDIVQNSGIWFRNRAEKSNLHLYTITHYAPRNGIYKKTLTSSTEGCVKHCTSPRQD